MRKNDGRLLLLFVAMLLPAAAFTGCNGESTSNDATSDSTDVPAEEATLPPGCEDDYDPLNPSLRMTYFDLQSPANLDNAVLENLMIEGFYNGDFIWLIDLTGVDDGSTDTDGTFHLFTGSGTMAEEGLPFETNCFKFMQEPAWQPADADLTITGDDISWTAGEEKIDILIPVFKTNVETGDKELLLELPLQEVEIVAGTLSADRTTMGSPGSCASGTGGGVLRGLVTVDDAKGVVVEDMGLTLCGLLSGDKGTNLNDPADDCQKDMAMWSDPPDTTNEEGDPAYTAGACFSAEDVTIVD
ncbi:MAG: hypothetical protein ABIJ56_22275 [Pseudomonadota bacterium]